MSFKDFVRICVVLAIVDISAGQSIDWCSVFCYNPPHIGCNNPGVTTWKIESLGLIHFSDPRIFPQIFPESSTCINPRVIPLTEAQKQLFLSAHNNLRNEVAHGRAQSDHFTLPSSSRMPRFTWNDDVEFLAGLNTKQCRMVIWEANLMTQKLTFINSGSWHLPRSS